MKDGEKRKNLSGDDFEEHIKISTEFEENDSFMDDLSASLKEQVNTQLNQHTKEEPMKIKKKKNHKGLKITGIILGVLTLCLVFLVATDIGRSLIYRVGAEYLAGRLDVVEPENQTPNDVFTEVTPEVDPVTGEVSDLRKESYVANFLLFGIEEIGGGGRSDSMMIASVNTKDNTIKLTSILRDCYVEIPGHNNNKLNAAYAFGGADLLVETIEKNFKIKLDGYASVNFESFEKIIDLLGGVDIELGSAEAQYLNTTNYISNPANRKVVAGMNHLNGNQALGYARVRYVATLGGASNDFGRTLRQRRVLNAMFEKYKSKNLVELFSIADQILPMIKTNVNADTITKVLTAVVENQIFTIENNRIPYEEHYSAIKNEVGAVLKLDFDANIKYLYHIIFLDELPQEQTVTE